MRSAAVETRRATWILQKTTFENHRGISIDDSFTPSQGLSFAFLDHTDNLLQIFFAKAARFDEMDEQRLGRAIENAIDEFPDHAANDLVFRMRRAVKEGAVLAALFEIALGFEDLHHGHDGGVSDFAAIEESFINVADGGGAAFPDELHDFELLGSQGVVLGAHSTFLVLINSYVKGKVRTPGLGGRESKTIGGR